MRKSLRSRIKITKTGKLLHRASGISHFKFKKSTKQKKRKKRLRKLQYKISKYY